jgi:hypothetical protein
VLKAQSSLEKKLPTPSNRNKRKNGLFKNRSWSWIGNTVEDIFDLVVNC